jgi:hypothetical protein
MQMLHAVHPGERLVSSGEYRYFTNGQPSGYEEHWQVTRLPNGQEVVRADVRGPDSQGSRSQIVTHLVREASGRPAWLRLRSGTGHLDRAAQYTFKEASVRIARQLAGEAVRQEVIDIAAGYEVDYPPVIGHDFVWRGYPVDGAGMRRAIPIFSPDLWGDDSEGGLTGRALRYNVRPLEVGLYHTPAGAFEEVRHFSITLSDGVRAEAWYDAQGVPLRWYYPDKDYDFLLVALDRLR